MADVSFNQVKGWVRTICTEIVFYVLMFLILASVLGQLNFKIPYIPAVNHEWLAYVCGAWWLLRK